MQLDGKMSQVGVDWHQSVLPQLWQSGENHFRRCLKQDYEAPPRGGTSAGT